MYDNWEIAEMHQHMKNLLDEGGPDWCEFLAEIIKYKGLAFAEKNFKEQLFDWCEHVVDFYEEGEDNPDYEELVQLVGKDFLKAFWEEELNEETINTERMNLTAPPF